MDPRHHDNAHWAGLAAPARARVIPADLAPLGAHHAAPAGLSPPRKDEPTEALAGAGGFRDQGRADSPDSAAADASEQAGAASAADAKRFATLRARLALAGWAIARNETGDGAPIYAATRWNMSRELAGLAAAEAFADRVGAPGMTTTKPDPARVHPLLFEACRCSTSGQLCCLACMRWRRHYRTVVRRLAAWRAAR